MKRISLFVFFALLSTTISAASFAQEFSRTVGGNIYGSVQLVDTLPELDPGIGGGMFFDYRFNEHYSIMLEAFFTTQDGSGRSTGEGDIIALAVPATTFKIYLLNSEKLDGYIGVGVGIYGLTEGSLANTTSGWGLGAQFETGLEYDVTSNLMAGVGGTFRSVGLINTFSGASNATTYMPFTLFGRIGYRF